MERHSLRRFYGRQIFKGALFASTALVLPAVAPRLALAQIAPGTTPQGGVIVGGSAAIAQAPGSTTVNQASQNAAINWQSFNVGSAAKVQFNQPNASAIALNRVVGGNLSQINGQINANGQIVLINQSGVVFGKGSQVNAESVVVSTSDIATSDFMAGRMNFSGAPKPGAQIINNGNITARDAGLVGLVAPQVANNGLITASLGQVVLAGGSAFTLDLYGDRLISLDVTQAVRAVDIGGKTLPALITNSGLIIADGGKITLTAQDADALVTQLINAGGTIRADTLGAQTGTISVQGVGGNISIAGNLLAQGNTAGSKGGAIEALATGTVAIAPSAVIDASGQAGGGYVAIGTDLTRTEAGPSDTAAPAAAAVTIARGASIKADAASIGNGGTITLLSRNDTAFDGAISAQGGAHGGNGGLAELSSRGVIDLTGTVTDIAIDGRPGEILLDPATLIVTASGGASSTTASEVSTHFLDGLTGNIVLSASSLLEVLSDVRAAATSLSLISGGAVSIEAYVSLNGSLEIDAGGSIFIGPSYSVIANQTIFSDTGGLSATDILLNSGTAGIDIGAQVNTSLGGTVVLDSGGGPVLESSFSGFTLNGAIPASTTVNGILESTYVSGGTAAIDGNVDLTNANAIATLSNLLVGGGHTLIVDDAAPLVIAGDVGANSVTFISSDSNPTDNFGFNVTGTLDAVSQLIFDSAKLVTEASTATITTDLLSLFGNGSHGSVSLPGTANAIAALGSVNAIDNLSLADSTILTLTGATSFAKSFDFGGDGITETGAGALSVPTFFTDGVLSGDVLLANTANSIGLISGLTLTTGTFAIADAANLQIAGGITAASLYIDLGTGDGLTLDNPAGKLDATGTGGVLSIVADSLSVPSIRGAIQAPNGTIAIAPATANEAITLTDENNNVAGLDLGSAFFVAINFGQDEKALQLGDASYTGQIDIGQNQFDTEDLSSADLILLSQGGAAQNGSLTAGAVSFDTKNFLQGTGGSIAAALFTGNATGGEVSLAGAANIIGTLGAVSASGNILITDSDASGLILSAPLTTAGAITLDNEAAGISENGGVIDAGTLSGAAGGNIALGGANLIGTLGAFSASGNILLDSTAFKIAGSVVANGTLTLEGGGAIELAGSGVQATVLTSDGSSMTGNVELTAGSNTIATLTNFLVGSGFGLNLDDTGLLNLAGTVSAGHASLTADTLALGGALNVIGLLTLGSQNGIAQSAGTLNAGTLASAGAIDGGNVSLGRGNTIGTLANFTVSAGNFTLDTSGTLDVAGTLFVGAADAAVLTTDGLTETGAVDAGTLVLPGTFGNLALTGANNIATISGVSLTGDFALNDSLALTLDGLIATGIDHSVSFGGVGITEDENGAISAGTLAGIGVLSGDVILDQANTIGSLNGLTLGGILSLTDTESLDVGNLRAATATFSNATASSLDITGFLSVAGTLLLDLTDVTLLESGSLTAGDLESGIATIASAVLDGVNHIATIGGFDANGTFDLTDASALTLSNGLTAAGINLADSDALELDALLQATANGIALAAPSVVIDAAGTISVPNAGLVSVAADTFSNAGSITASAGTFAIAPFSLTAIDLGGNAANALDLNAADFAIADLSELIIGAAAGHQASSVTIDDFSASTSIALVSLFASGEITDAGLLEANAIAVAGASFGQSATGTIITGTLAAGGPISGDVSLASAHNSIGALGALTLTGGALTLDDQVSLNVAGGVLARDITLEDLVAIALGAPVSVTSGGTIKLIADALTDTNAAIDAGTTGTVEIAPYNSTNDIDLGGSSISGLQLTPGLISLISAGVLAIGTAGGGAIFAEGKVSVTPGDLLLTGSAIDFEGTLAGPGLLSLASAGALSEAPDAAIAFATIAGVGGDTGLGGDNTIGTIGDFSASGNIVLNDFESLVIDGLVQTPGDISLEGNYFREISGGILSAATLNSGGDFIGGDVFLTNVNSIGVLDNFFVDNGGTLDFADGQALILGSVSAPDATLSASSLDFAGIFDASGVLALAAAGSITQSAGSIDAGTLVSLGSIGGNVLLTGQNAILNLGAFSLGSGFTLALTDASALVISGPVTAPVTSLAADGITFAGNLDAATRLVLASTGAMTQSNGGIITTSLLSSMGSIGGDLLLGGANAIGTLANISVGAGDTLSLNDAGNLVLAGDITAPFASFTAATIDLAGTINAATLLAFGGSQITQTAGSIDAGELISLGSIAGDVILTRANSIHAIGGTTLDGDFELNDTGSLDITGMLTAKFVQFADPDTIFESGAGAIQATTLTSGAATLGGDLLLTGLNSIDTLGAIALSSGTFSLFDAGRLEVAGEVTAPVATISAAGIDIAGALNGNYLALSSPVGTISESTGTIGVGTLVSNGAIGGDAYLTQTNVIGTLANFTMGTGATLSLTDGETLTLAGLVDAPDSTFTAPGLIFDGTLDAGQVLALTGAASVIEGANGGIIAGTLTSLGTVDGDVFLTGDNTIGQVANFTVGTGDTFDLNDTGLLTIDGPLAGSFITLASATIAIPGGIVATQTLALASPGTIFEDGGSIFASTVTSHDTTIGGDFILLGNNNIGAISAIQIDGDFSLKNTGSLRLFDITDQDGIFTLEDNGNVSGSLLRAATFTSGNTTIGGNLLLTGSNNIKNLGNLTIAAGHTFILSNEDFDVVGTVFAPFMTLESAPSVNISGALGGTFLTSQDNILTETTGTISYDTLSGSGDTVLLGNANEIGTLTNFNANTISLNDIEALVLAGSIVAPNATFSAAGLNLTGTIDAADTLALGSTAGISQTAGIITAGTLLSLGTITGAVALTDANSIAVIGNFAAAGDIALKDAESYAIAGTLAAGPTLTLEGAGLSETGAGAIHAATLTSAGTTLAGGATLNGANAIATLADFRTSTNLFLNDTKSLILAGTIAAATLGLADTANVSQSGGGILAKTLTTDGAAIGGGVILNGTGNSIAELGNFAAASLALFDTENLVIAAPVSLTGALALADTGLIEQTAGSITAASLTSDGQTIGESAIFNEAGNQIGAIGDFAAAGGLSVVDDHDLDLTGIINVAGLYLSDPGFAITQTGGSIGTDLMNASAAGITLAAANSIAALGIINAGGLIANGVLSITGPVNVGTGTITSPSGLLINGNIYASGDLSLHSIGDLQQVAGVINAGNADLVGIQNIKLAGTDNAAGNFSAQASGVFTTSGTITAQNIDLGGFSAFTQSAGSIGGASVRLYSVNQTGLYGTISATNLYVGSGHQIDDNAALLTAGNATFVAGESGIVLNGNNNIANRLIATGGDVYQESGTIQASDLDITSSNYFIGLDGRVLAGSATLTALQTENLPSDTGILLHGDISIGGALALNGGTVIDQSGGTITAANLTGSAASGITLAANIDAGNLALTAASVSLYGTEIIAGNVTTRGADFRQSGGLSATNAYLSASNYLGLNGAVSITNALDLTAGNSIADNATELSAQTGTFQAPSIFLNGDNNFATNLVARATGGQIVQQRGAIAAPQFSLSATGPIELNGVLTSTDASLTAGGMIDLNGAARITDDLYLRAINDILAPGTVSAGTLTGAVTGAGDEQAIFLGTEFIGTIGSFVMQDSTFALNDRGPLTIIGPLVANAVSITAVGQISLDGGNDGGLFIAGTIAPKTQTTPGPGDSVLAVTQGPNGAMPAIIQTGTFYIDSGPLAPVYGSFDNAPATLFMMTTPEGNIEFAPAPPNDGGLVGPSIDVIMSVGNGGTVSGNVDLLTLVLLSGKATDLTGMLDGLSGAAASGKGSVLPFPRPPYQFNACPIGSVNCIILPIETLPPGNPLQNFDIDQRKKKRLDKSVTLPGVATRDF